MLKYCKITKIAYYEDKKYAITNKYFTDFKLLEDTEIQPDKEIVITWDNILDYKDELCQLSPWSQLRGLQKKKYKKFWIDADYLIRERFHPEMKVTLKYTTEEIEPTLDTLLKHFDWSKVYTYITQQINNKENK